MKLQEKLTKLSCLHYFNEIDWMLKKKWKTEGQLLNSFKYNF